MPTPIVHTLPTGLSVVCVPMEGVKSVTVLALVGTGSRFETPSTNGISHFLEHMVFKGTANYPTASILASAVDVVGAEFNAFTSKEYTGYYVKSASDNLPLALDVVSDMLFTPLLREEDLEREKGVIVEEIHMYEDSPSRHIGDVFEQLMFAGSPLGRDIIGTEETVRSFHASDFTSHLNQWYGPKNVTLVVAGDERVVGSQAALSRITEAFSKSSEGRRTPPTMDTIQTLKVNPISKGEKLCVVYKDTQQAHFSMAFPGVSRHDPRRHALTILATLLGGNMSSRLFTEVREKRGLCYYVHSDQDHYHDCGSVGASAGVDPSRVDEAIKVVREQLVQLVDESGPHGVTEKEVADAKSHVVGSTVLELEDSQAVAQLYGMSKLLQNSIETPEEKLSKLQAVTLEEVRSVARELIKPDQLFFAIIGPYKDPERFARLLQ